MSPTARLPERAGDSSNPIEIGSAQSRGAAEFVAELAQGEDSRTGQEFGIGPEGGLVTAPTRRVALIDRLIRIDPKVAGAQARRILSEFSSPDEWAIALRASALADRSPEGRAYLEERL